MSTEKSYLNQTVCKMKKQKIVMFFLLSLCLVSILLIYIFSSYQELSTDKRPNKTRNKTDIFKEEKIPEPTKQMIFMQKEPTITSKSSTINSTGADSESEILLNDFLKGENLLLIANIGRESYRFLQNKNSFYNKATQEQKNKGNEVLSKLRSAMKIPANLQFQAIVTKEDHEKPSYTGDCFFKLPHYYREETSGEFNYKYVTDGVFEITNYAEDTIEFFPGIVSRDLNERVFFDMFPVRFMLDSDLIWIDKKVINSEVIEETEVEVIGNWFYDINVRTSDNLVHQLTFYDRKNRSQEIIRICDIEYKSFAVDDPRTKVRRTHTLPIRYIIIYNDANKTETCTVSLEYKNFDKEIAQNRFNLNLDTYQQPTK